MNEDTTQTTVANATDPQNTPNLEKQEKTTSVTNTPTQNTSVGSKPKHDPTALVLPDPTPVPEDTKKLSDVTETSLVWISGLIGGRQIDCAGPIELPFKITKPTWPYTPVEPNSTYANQVFDYDNGTWIATDAKSQGQQISDLVQKVQDLQKDSENHDKSADRAEKMGVQTTRILTRLTQQISTISQKLDTVLNTKDGDK